MLQLKGWKLFTDGTRVKAEHKCGKVYAGDVIDEESLEPWAMWINIIGHVC